MEGNVTTVKPSSEHTRPFAQYRSIDDRYDEFIGVDGKPREHWVALAKHFDRLGLNGIQEYSDESARAVHESGANIRITREQQVRPWQLNIIPLVIAADSWQELESGLQQRVRLLEVVLSDLLGPKRLIHEKVFPPELLSANPHYWRAYHELSNAVPKLNVTATDLARDDDGSWWATGDRTRAPSGLGFALENRIITGRLLPRLMRTGNVIRLASFFESLQGQLYSLASDYAKARVAILTPEKSSYRYVEDAYLAKYLGCSFVEGRDLTVRGNRIHLRTLGGLVPIDVLFRHISDSEVDPLELNPDSKLGVPGLLDAIRGGNIAVANGVGSALAEMPALLPFLNAASHFFFGEDLTVRNIPTYWCGGVSEMKYVIEHLDELIIRDAFKISGQEPIDASMMTSDQRADLISKIQAAPHCYVGQKRPARSRTPIWSKDGLDSWHVALRTFHLQTADTVDVLPGGLVRVSPDPHSLDHSPISGRLGQDCWVVGEEPVNHQKTLLPPSNAKVQIKRVGSELPSRVAENLFWLGRYSERAESIARLLRVTISRIAGESSIEQLPDLPRLIASLAAVGQIAPDYAVQELQKSLPQLDVVLPRSLFSSIEQGGIRQCVGRIVDQAIATRDRLSMDAYRLITKMGDEILDGNARSNCDMAAAIELINRLIGDLLAFSGLTHESMTRTHGWRFLELGRRIERGYQTAELLEICLVKDCKDNKPLLESILHATDSLMTYRSRYLLQMSPAPLLDLLITDETNPRSIAFQIKDICQLIEELPTESNNRRGKSAKSICQSLYKACRNADPESLAESSKDEFRSELSRVLWRLMSDLPLISDHLTAQYFLHLGTAQSLSGRSNDKYSTVKNN